VLSKLLELTERLTESYDREGGINHLDGENLPSKQAVAEITGDLLRLLFPGFFDEKLIHSSKLAPETATLHRLSALLKKTSLLVSNCSGTKHIAQASGVSTLGIYGSSRPENWTPPGDPDPQVIRNETLACVGCRGNDCAIGVKCLRELSPDAVFAKLVAMPMVKNLTENT